ERKLTFVVQKPELLLCLIRFVFVVSLPYPRTPWHPWSFRFSPVFLASLRLCVKNLVCSRRSLRRSDPTAKRPYRGRARSPSGPSQFSSVRLGGSCCQE